MQTKVIGEAINLTVAAAGTAVTLNGTPFMQNREATVVISTSGLAGATLRIQTSEDNSTWTDLVTVNSQGPVKMAQFRVTPYIRYNVTTAGTGGTANVYLLGAA